MRQSGAGEIDADIFGQVVEYGTGQPVTNVEVQIEGQGKTAITDANGRFFIRNAIGPEATVRFQHLSYAPREAFLEMEPGIAYELEVQMEPEPLEIPGIVVSTTPRPVARRLEPVFARMDRVVTAYFRTKEDFEQRGYPPVGAMVRGLPSVRVRNAGMRWIVEMRGAMTLDGQRCRPVVYLDGMRVSSSDDEASLSEMMAMPTFDVAVIEVYPGAASLPPEFNDPGTMCAIGIWTARGGGL
ncbi:MAG: TonB-dependent receptor [Gemmatimonadetes bacterium]|nr:TonB-dependent receptor [Gemmatimonadota bacterium]